MMSAKTTPMHRRGFLKAAISAAPAPAILPAASLRDTPNVLVIMSDEHNWSVAGCYGNHVARTPHLDRLASQGVTFDAAYCNSPICAPSRMAFTAGKYIHRLNAWNNHCKLASDTIPSLPRALNAAGYESFLCGKQHYDIKHRYGFQEVGGNMNQWIKHGRGKRRKADDESINVQAGTERFAEFRAGEESEVMSHDRDVTAGAIEFLRNRGRSEKPFLLFAGYLAPHFPLIVPERNWRHYRGRVQNPRIPAGYFDSMPLNYMHLRRGFGLVGMGPELIRRGRELYYGLTEWADEQIGMVLHALAGRPYADNTVVIYTSDHGENMGEHGLWWKNCAYEHATRVPLIVRWPARWRGGQRRGGPCSTVDLVKTIAGLGGASVPDDWNGASMLPWLDQPKTTWRNLAVSQYYDKNVASGLAMLRSDDWKYVYHAPPDADHPAERELYRLGGDAGEYRNLAGLSEFRGRVDALHQRLLRELGEHPDDIEARCRRDIARGYADA